MIRPIPLGLLVGILCNIKGISPARMPLYAVYTMSRLACPFASRCDTQCNILISYPGGDEILLLSSCSKDSMLILDKSLKPKLEPRSRKD